MNNITTNTHIKNWVWWLVLGIVLIVLGLFLLSTPVMTTFASVFTIGFLLVVGGIIQAIAAVFDRQSGHLWLNLVVAIMAIIIGVIMILKPGVTVLALTLLIAAFLLSSGIFRIIGSLMTRFTGWGWYLLNGIISLILGILILMQWPSSALWVIGLFVGIDFLLAGWSLVMISLFVKKRFLAV